MPEWHKWVTEDLEEMDDQYETLKKIKKKVRSMLEALQ